jgi:DNA-binding LytR/AlgR family response regulator
MDKLTCIIADDEPLALSLLQGYVEKTPFLELVKACNSGIEVLGHLEEEDIDLLFLDIQMPGLSGMNLAKSLDKDGPRVIFTTAFEQYAIEGYKVDAIDYLLKPFGFEDFLNAAQKAKKKILEQKNAIKAALADSSAPGHIIVKSDYKLKQIGLNDILYIEGLKDYVKIFRKSDNKVILTLLSMKNLEATLPPEQFMRVHRSFIVNLNEIQTIERGNIIFGELYIPVSDKYKDDFQAFLNKRFLE